MSDIYATEIKRDHRRTRMLVKAEVLLGVLQRNIKTTAQLAIAAEWEHPFATG